MKAMCLFSCLYMKPAAIHFRNNDKMLILSEIRVFPLYSYKNGSTGYLKEDACAIPIPF